MTKKITKPALLKDQIVIEFLDPFPPNMHQEILDSWYELGDKLKDIIVNETLDFHHLGALIDIINVKRNEDHQVRRHAMKIKKDYRGTQELAQFIKDYKNRDVVPDMISIDYKPLYKNGDKSKPIDKETFNSKSSTVLKIRGKQLIKFLIHQITSGTLDDTLKAYSGFINEPPIALEDYPNKKTEFVARHNKSAVKILTQFFNNQKLPPREVKLATIKSLVYMGFVKTYREYKKEFGSKNRKIAGEEEYYISRYTDLFKDR